MISLSDEAFPYGNTALATAKALVIILVLLLLLLITVFLNGALISLLTKPYAQHASQHLLTLELLQSQTQTWTLQPASLDSVLSEARYCFYPLDVLCSDQKINVAVSFLISNRVSNRATSSFGS